MRKLRINHNEKGFTLIELMIVIAIIGILAAIAIPNYISYRNKSFCSQAESDNASIASALADYFAIPDNVSYNQAPTSTLVIPFAGSENVSLSGNNEALINEQSTTTGYTYEIVVYDKSDRCPDNYISSQVISGGEGWKAGAVGLNYFQKTI